MRSFKDIRRSFDIDLNVCDIKIMKLKVRQCFSDKEKIIVFIFIYLKMQNTLKVSSRLKMGFQELFTPNSKSPFHNGLGDWRSLKKGNFS